LFPPIQEDPCAIWAASLGSARLSDAVATLRWTLSMATLYSPPVTTRCPATNHNAQRHDIRGKTIGKIQKRDQSVTIDDRDMADARGEVAGSGWAQAMPLTR